MLERDYNSENKDPRVEPLSYDKKLMFTIGDIVEALVDVAIRQSKHLRVVSTNGKCSLTLKNGVIQGEFDLIVEMGGEYYLWDIKTASPYSFDNKFSNFDVLNAGDDFGYVGQLIGYSQAEPDLEELKGKEIIPAGWIVINKVNGAIKVLEIPEHRRDEIILDKMAELNDTYDKMGDPTTEIPPCTGVEDETFYKKPTGRKVLSKKCSFCNCKQICHEDNGGVVEMAQPESKAKNPPRKWYIKDSIEEDGTPKEVKPTKKKAEGLPIENVGYDAYDMDLLK